MILPAFAFMWIAQWRSGGALVGAPLNDRGLVAISSANEDVFFPGSGAA